MDGGAWWATVHGVPKSRTRMSDLTFTFTFQVGHSFSRSKRLLISWLQSPSAVILEPKKIEPLTVSIVSPCICHEVMGPDAMISVFLCGFVLSRVFACSSSRASWSILEFFLFVVCFVCNFNLEIYESFSNKKFNGIKKMSINFISN